MSVSVMLLGELCTDCICTARVAILYGEHEYVQVQVLHLLCNLTLRTFYEDT